MPDAGIQVEAAGEETVVRLQGRLDQRRIAPLWQRLTECLQRPQLKSLILDLRELQGIDSAGVALLRLLAKRCRGRGVLCERRDVPPEVAEFLAYVDEQSAAEGESAEAPAPGLIVRSGLRAREKMAALRDLAEFAGAFLLALTSVLRHPRRLRLLEALFQMQKAGAEATFFVGWLAILMGFIMGIQASTTLTQFGAQIHVADVVTIGTIKEMAPLLTAVIIAGRSGAAFAAEIGTMKVKQEIDALRVMGFSPMDFLVLPRVLGLALAGPLLTLVADASGIVGGMIVGWLVLDLSVVNYFTEVGLVITASIFFEGLLKGFAFSLLVGINGCFHGLRTGAAAEDVGIQTTVSVVTGILLIVLSDALLSGIFHVYEF